MRSADESMNLCRDLLAPGDFYNLLSIGEFIVESPLYPGRSYLLSRYGLVWVYQGKTPIATLCLHPVADLPWPDRILIHFLLIEGDEERYLRTANVYWLPQSCLRFFLR